MAYHGTQGDPQGRVICANCHANNFAGQAQCWQCRAPLSAGGGCPVAHRPTSLPPQVAAPAPLPQGVLPVAERAPATRPSALLLIGIGMMTFVIVLILAMRSQSGAPGAGRLATSASEVNSGMAVGRDKSLAPAMSAGASAPDTESGAPTSQATSTNQSTSTSTPATTGGDPLEDAARRTISREAPNVGLPPSGAVSSDGQVHLRSGGAISVEEWNEAKRKLQDNPLLKEPPPPPPF
jgi:hypothetical protein